MHKRIIDQLHFIGSEAPTLTGAFQSASFYQGEVEVRLNDNNSVASYTLTLAREQQCHDICLLGSVNRGGCVSKLMSTRQF